MFDQMRYSAGNGNSPIAGALLRALTERGELSIPALRSLSPLSDKAQVEVDRAVVQVGLERLTVVADLLSEGLTYPLSNPLSVTQIEWEAVNKTGYAQRTMSPSARGEFQMQDRKLKRIPVYLTTDDFSVGIRTLLASQRVGTPIDTSLVGQATRRVNEALEDAAINGATTLDGQNFHDSGYTAPGIINAPGATTVELGVDWTIPALPDYSTGPKMLADVMNLIAVAQSQQRYGPFNLYVGTKAGQVIENDFKANGDRSIRARLESVEAGGRPIRIRVADRMPQASTGVQLALVQMTSDVIDIVTGQPPTVIPWTSLDGFTLFWLVMAIQIPRVKTDYNGAAGIFLGVNNVALLRETENKTGVRVQGESLPFGADVPSGAFGAQGMKTDAELAKEKAEGKTHLPPTGTMSEKPGGEQKPNDKK
jgi:Family of unknown function (DUF6260)